MKEAFFLLSIHPFFMCGCCMYPNLKSESLLDIKDPDIHAEVVISPEITSYVPVKTILLKKPIVLAEKKKDWKNVATSRIKFFEGFSNTTYRCEAGELTIGYGFTGKFTNQSWISRAESDKILEKELVRCQIAVKRIVKVKLSNSQLWSLSSFTYNCGEGSLMKLVNGKGRLNSGNYSSVPKLLPLYCKVAGKQLKGLSNRRDWEAKLWNEKS